MVRPPSPTPLPSLSVGTTPLCRRDARESKLSPTPGERVITPPPSQRHRSNPKESGSRVGSPFPPQLYRSKNPPQIPRKRRLVASVPTTKLPMSKQRSPRLGCPVNRSRQSKNRRRPRHRQRLNRPNPPRFLLWKKSDHRSRLPKSSSRRHHRRYPFNELEHPSDRLKMSLKTPGLPRLQMERLMRRHPSMPTANPRTPLERSPPSLPRSLLQSRTPTKNRKHALNQSLAKQTKSHGGRREPPAESLLPIAVP